MTQQLIIRTSDRGAFKRCRKSWDLGSKIRKNLQPKGPMPKPLDFGTAIHAALEVYYDPETWGWDRSVVEALALARFSEEQEGQLQTYLRDIGQGHGGGITDEEIRNDFAERWTLGEGMLKHYFQWSKINDTDWTPLYVELEFEVVIPGLEGTYAEGAVYQGRIDLVIKDRLDRYWIVDHKTAARFDSTAHLELDPQCGSYAWALQHMLGIPIAGVVYNELYKGVPGPPTRLKRGGFSKNKSQDTSYDLYVQTLMEEYGEIPSDYEDHLEFLKTKESVYFRRTRVHRSAAELQKLGESVRLEALDMLDPDLRIYPNPTKFNCQNCMFRTPCLIEHEGGDVDWVLRENYEQRN